MKISTYSAAGGIYSSNVYLLTGSWNTLSDCNTMIDTGRDPAIFDFLERAPCGVGQRRLEQVILTHSHYDHCELILTIKERYKADILAFSSALEGADKRLSDGDELRAGDGTLQIIHTPGHSSDSICCYCPEAQALFSGDTPLIVNSAGGVYETPYVEALARLCALPIRSIFPGHGPPITERCNERLNMTLQNVRDSAVRG